MPDEITTRTEQPALPVRPLSPAAERSVRRRRLLAAQDFIQKISLENPKVRYRYREGFQTGTLHPSIEKTLLELGWGRPQALDKRLLDAIGASAGRGLINLILRKSLDTDPLAEAKPVGSGTTIEQAQQPAALEPRPSIVPASRPSQKRKGAGPPLKPGEEVMS